MLTTRRFPGSTTLEVQGSLPVDSQAIFRNVSVDNPSTYLGAMLREGLASNGVEMRGPVVDVDALDDAPSRDDAIYLLTHRSAPLSTLAATMMKNSQNLYAETVLKTLGRADGIGTFEGGRRAVRGIIDHWGIAPGALQVVDGSGLSRYNLATPEALLSVLEHVYDDERLREPFLAALPVAGRDGTLERRLQGTAAEGNLRAKTGSMSNVRTLAGYVWTADDEPVAFAIMFNNAPMPALADETIDAIVVALAEFSRN
jgi:D-alanyl-D-alanine carboxypeptidase/D-alanyl-D-alanine-endopeptidase (penicillin-binding protein 4)